MILQKTPLKVYSNLKQQKQPGQQAKMNLSDLGAENQQQIIPTL